MLVRIKHNASQCLPQCFKKQPLKVALGAFFLRNYDVKKKGYTLEPQGEKHKTMLSK